MANGDLLLQIDCMLDSGEISGKAGSRLMLEVLRQMYTDQKTLKEKLEKMFPVYRITLWVGSGLGISILVFIWAILTHQVTITWP